MNQLNEHIFQETLVNALKYDSKVKHMKNALLPIIARSTINSVPQYDYAIRSGQHWENVEVRVPIPLIDSANEHEDAIEELVGYVYEESNEYALRRVLIKPSIIPTPVNEYIEHNVVFNEIQDVVVQGIRDAKYLIWVAVAWFSNEAIYNELISQKRNGLSVRVIVSDEPSNQKLIEKMEGQFELVVIPRRGWNDYNRMHEKFCIIDLDYVMHGTYNWTPTANGNDETLATALDREYVDKFSNEFMRMFTKQQ